MPTTPPTRPTPSTSPGSPISSAFDADTTEVIHAKLRDAQTPGFEAEFDPDEAERAGAFAEDALSEADARAGTDDMADHFAEVMVDTGSTEATAFGALEPAFVDDDSTRVDPPSHVSTTNARELFDLQLGETVAGAAARKAKEG